MDDAMNRVGCWGMKYLIVLMLMLLAFAANGTTLENIIEGAYGEINNKTKYNTDMLEGYVTTTYLSKRDTGRPVYPGGDVNPAEGVCSDLIVRALRNAGIDLQKLVHLDILNNKSTYGVQRPDKYIDHRRVWILKTYFNRHWKRLTNKLEKPEDWQPGDIVIWDIGSKRHLHIGIIGRTRREDGYPNVIHNMRYVPFIFTGKTIEQDLLEGPKLSGVVVDEWFIIGHYRIKNSN